MSGMISSPICTPMLLQNEPWAHPTPSPSPFLRVVPDPGPDPDSPEPNGDSWLPPDKLWTVCRPFIQLMLEALHQEIEAQLRGAATRAQEVTSASSASPATPEHDVEFDGASAFSSLLKPSGGGHGKVPVVEEEECLSEDDVDQPHPMTAFGCLMGNSGLGSGMSATPADCETPQSLGRSTSTVSAPAAVGGWSALAADLGDNGMTDEEESSLLKGPSSQQRIEASAIAPVPVGRVHSSTREPTSPSTQGPESSRQVLLSTVSAQNVAAVAGAVATTSTAQVATFGQASPQQQQPQLQPQPQPQPQPQLLQAGLLEERHSPAASSSTQTAGTPNPAVMEALVAARAAGSPSAILSTTPAEAPPGPGAEKSVMVCRHWKSKGWCRLGNDCKFLHPEHKRGSGIVPRRSVGAGATAAGMAFALGDDIPHEGPGDSAGASAEASGPMDAGGGVSRVRRGGKKNRRSSGSDGAVAVPVIGAVAMVPGLVSSGPPTSATQVPGFGLPGGDPRS